MGGAVVNLTVNHALEAQMAEKTHILSHWTQHMEGLNQSTQEFYSMVNRRSKRRRFRM